MAAWFEGLMLLKYRLVMSMSRVLIGGSDTTNVPVTCAGV